MGQDMTAPKLFTAWFYCEPCNESWETDSDEYTPADKDGVPEFAEEPCPTCGTYTSPDSIEEIAEGDRE